MRRLWRGGDAVGCGVGSVRGSGTNGRGGSRDARIRTGTQPLDTLFDELVGERNDRQLLFSTCVDLLATVVCRVNRSVNTAYRAAEAIPVSVAALDQRRQRLPTVAAEELVRHTARKLAPSSPR